LRKAIENTKLSIRKISEKAASKDEVVRFDIGQPSFDTPEHVKEAARQGLEQRQGYAPTMGLERLRELAAEEESMKRGVNFSKENILVTVGGMEALYSVFTSYLTSSDKAVFSDPCWGPYKLISSVNGNEFSQVKYFDEEGLRPEVKEEFEEAELAVVNTPSNPTGRVLSREEAEQIGELANETDTLLVCDEVYHRLTYSKKHISPSEFAENSVIIGSCSKNHAMTGWRIGWVAGPTEVVNNLAKTSRGMTACPPKISQLAAIEALENDQHVDKMRREYSKRRELVVEEMQELGWDFVSPEGAIYAFPEVERDSWECCLDMIEEGVAMVPGEPFGPESDTNVRICFGSTTEKEIKKAFDRLRTEI
jgi:aspartate aminotransferase